MKKAVIFLAVALMAIALAPAASALPLFARQTGMACNACHFQHFPLLNSFGRAFKIGAFTMIGSQTKVEGEGLSLPSSLNMAVLATSGYTKTNGAGAGTNNGVRNPGNGSVYVPGTNGEFSLFAGGHVSDNVGALAELGMLNDAGTGAGLSSAKIPMLWDVADGTRAGMVPFTTKGQGASYGFELLNTGANAIHTMLFIGGDFNGSIAPILSAQQYIGTGAAATGAAFVATHSMGFINLTKFHQVGPADLGGTGAALTSTYLRVAGIFDLAGWDSAVGIQHWSGTSTVATFESTDPFTGVATPGGLALVGTRATAIDGQMQGQLGNMPAGIYASYARAPSDAVVSNTFNGGTDTRSSFNIAAELGVIPEKATVGFGFRRGKSGMTVGTATNATDNAWLIEASYKLSQNVMLSLCHTSQSGEFWDAARTAAIGSTQTTLNLATIF